MKPTIQISNSAGICCIDIEGTIGTPETWQFDEPSDRVATYERFREEVARIAALDAPDIVVNIRSTGGDVNDALLIYEALRSLDARITTRCFGYTASAATIIAQAAGEGLREIAGSALYLIHNSICTTEGNAAELQSRIELLRKTDERLASLYAERSGRPVDTFTELMAQNNGMGRWLSPEEAVEAGLADRILEKAETKPQAASFTRDIARTWNRWLARAGLCAREPEDGLPQDRNILHFDDGTRSNDTERTLRLFDDARNRIEPTRTEPKEDPTANEVRRSANARAYDEDARRFMQ